VAYRFVQFPMTLNNLRGHSQVAFFSNAIRRTFFCDVSHGFNLHDASRGPAAIADLLLFLEDLKVLLHQTLPIPITLQLQNY